MIITEATYDNSEFFLGMYLNRYYICDKKWLYWRLIRNYLEREYGQALPYNKGMNPVMTKYFLSVIEELKCQ